MEPERSGSDGKDTGISEKRGRFQEAGEAEGRNGEKGGREGIQRRRDAEMGTADTETGWDIYGTDPGASQSKHCKEAVFSDVFIWALNGRGKGKSVQVDPQVKLHYQNNIIFLNF